MNLTLDAESEKRIQREIDLGHFSDPAKVIAHALDLLDEEADWLSDKKAIADHLDESCAQIERGEGIPGDQVRDLLAKRRADSAKACGSWTGQAKANDGVACQKKLRDEW